MSDVTYVVQAAVDAEDPTWRDIASVSVPPRTHRKTVIAKAVESAGMNGETRLVLRVLDPESAQEIPVSMEQPPPQLRIG